MIVFGWRYPKDKTRKSCIINKFIEKKTDVFVLKNLYYCLLGVYLIRISRKNVRILKGL